MNSRARLCLSAVIILGALLTLGVITANADTPNLINYQGVLKSGGVPVINQVTVVFNLYNAPTVGASFWSETQNVTPDADGRFNVTLGSVASIPDSIFWGTNVYLGVKVGLDAEMTPRQRLVATGYAFSDAWGRENTARGVDAAMGGGLGNIASGDSSFVGGGTRNTASGIGTTIGGGYRNFLEGSFSTIAGGDSNVILAPEIWSTHSFIGGGVKNAIESAGSGSISGGDRNHLGRWGWLSFIGGGDHNTIDQERSVICGGSRNEIQYTANVTKSSFIGAGSDNSISAGSGCVIGGGMNNTIIQYADGSVIAGGLDNIVTNRYSAVLGGMRNQAMGEFSVIAGGGGYWSQQDSNAAVGFLSSILGGRNNVASGDSSSIGGGTQNTASGASATVPGGHHNEASGTHSFAAGHRAKALRDGSFVWGDATDADFEATFPNQFLIRASGGVGIGTNTPTHELEVSGDVGMSGDLYVPSDSRIINDNNRAVFHTAWNSTFGDFTAINSGYDWTSKEPTSVVAARNGVFFTIGSSGSAFSTILAKIDTLGNMGIGTSSPTQKLHVSGNICYTGSIAACSDARYKTGVTTITNSLDKVTLLRGVRYKWKQDEYPERGFDNNSHLGFIGQEIETLFPEIVLTDGNGYKSVDYSRLTPVLVEAIKDLKAENDSRQSRIDQLEAQMAEMRELLNQLAAERQ